MEKQDKEKASSTPSPAVTSISSSSLLSYVSLLFLKQSLRSSALLSSINNDVSDNDLEALINNGHRMEFAPHQYLVRQGVQSQPTDHLYIIEDGDVKVQVAQAGAEPVTVSTVKQSDVVGDQSLYTDHPPSASIVTDSIVHAYAIPKQAFDHFIEQHPTVQDNLQHRKWLWSTLSKLPQFSDLDDDIKKEALIASFEQERVPGGRVIINFGEVGDRFYVVESGQCDVSVPFAVTAAPATTPATITPTTTTWSSTSTSVTQVDLIAPPASPIISSPTPFTAGALLDEVVSDKTPSDVKVATKGPNDSFGEIALLYSVPRSASVTCSSPSGCVLWSVDAPTFRSTCTEASLFLKKVFFEHASVRDKTTGQLLMTDKDFFAALRKTGVATPGKKGKAAKASEQDADPTKASALSESQLTLMFRLADQSGDNLISFSEFVLLNSLLRTPLSKYQFAFRMFDKDKSGTIDRDEFIQVVKSLTEDKTNTHDWSHDPFIIDLFGEEHAPAKKVLTYAQFESLLNRDVLPSFLSAVKHDLRAVDEYWMRWNQAMIADSGLGMIATDGKTAFAYPSWKSLVAGGIAGAVSRTVVSPLERIKLLFQMQGKPPKYTGMWQAFKLIYKEDGLRGYFTGNLSNVIRITPTSAFQFFFYDLYKRVFFSGRSELNPLERLGAGGLAGCTACVLTYPLDLIRARLTLQSGADRQYKGIIHAFTSVVRTEGFLALYKGLWPSVAGIFPYIGIDFMCYETLRGLLPYNQYFRNSHGDPRKHALLACGAMAGVVGQTVAYPLDLVRRRMQVQGWEGGKTHYKYDGGIWKTMKQIVKDEGVTEQHRAQSVDIRGLYRGMIPNYWKVVPAVSISFVTYEHMRKILNI